MMRLEANMSWPAGTHVDEQAPDFTLKDERGADWRLSDKRGQVVVMLFYPGDETPVCTKQMCSVRDHWADYHATGAEIVGISTDTVESHLKFSENHELPLRLLADPDGKVTSLYGVRSWIPGRSARAVIVIDAHGVVRHRQVQPLSLFRPKDSQVIEAIRTAQSDQGTRASSVVL
ncbi:MAG: thioredoxin-dependent peroxiredoxin [Acidobacteriota bacterium]|jgi:peroxiredoxin Q/BCP|nr:thioredoxin-dependent peroxiredoxin [Acidobacteriota bacterium]